jgi:hypothetical protein
MSITIDGIEYWTKKDYLQSSGIPRSRKGVDITARPDAYTSGLAPGGIWQRSDSGITLYLPGRKDIRAELQPTADEVSAAAQVAEREFTSKHPNRKNKARSLSAARTSFCAVGTRKTKLALNKLAKTSTYAKALRIALEIEDKNLTAKKYHGGDIGGYTYNEIAYFAKHDGILELIEICRSEGWTLGIQESPVVGATHVIYFDLPGVEQISWHFTPPLQHGLSTYSGVWDGAKNSTLQKLEAAIIRLMNPAAVVGQAA